MSLRNILPNETVEHYVARMQDMLDRLKTQRTRELRLLEEKGKRVPLKLVINDRFGSLAD